MNVFVLCTGRCGSVTFEKACRYMNNYSSSHEAESGIHISQRLGFGGNHIEVDNRLSWMLGTLDKKYGDDAFYVHLKRDRLSTAKSYNQRWQSDVSIVKAYTQGVLMRDSQSLDDCLDYYDTVNENIELFLKDKNKKISIDLENIKSGFEVFWNEIGAEGDLSSALLELDSISNPTESTSNSKSKSSVGGHHSFRSLKQISLIEELTKEIIDLKRDFNSATNAILEKSDSVSDLTNHVATCASENNKIITQIRNNNKLRSQVELENKNENLESRLTKEALLSKQNKIRIRQLEHSLAMELGSALIKISKSPINILKSPYILYSAVQRYKKNSKLLASAAKELNKISKSSSWPRAQKSAIIYQANDIAKTDGFDSAIGFVQYYGSDLDKLSARTLEANKNINSDKLWLKNINEYITSYGVKPIELESKSGERFFKITTPKLPLIDSSSKVSIIMPAYNAEETIDFAINSILSQTWKNIELIVVDDASNDSTFNIIEKIAEKDTRVKVFKNSVNVGPYVSKNFGLQHVTGDYITGHDSDDWAHPQRIEQQVEAMIAKPNLKATLSKMLRVDEKGSVTTFSKVGKTSTDGVIRIASISCMFENEFFKQKLGSWDCVRFGADSELIYRTQKILGDDFEELNLFGMICLDREGSLTNDPTHGVSKTTGISPTRKYYRDQWTNWHQDLDIDNAYLSFPQENRKFDAPEAALVNNSDINKLLS